MVRRLSRSTFAAPAWLLCMAWWMAWCVPLAAAEGGVGVLTVDGAIGPAHADYIVRGIAQSAALGQPLLVLKIDTPGGLDSAMRAVVKAVLDSPVPVAAWVAPSGARAASAGTYILYASHVAAMAPGTNLGAATPVEIGLGRQAPQPESGKPAPPAQGGAMQRKQVNDASAYLRALAHLRGRNAEWAERAVREAVSLTAEEALQQKVIEVVAADLPALLAQLDGRNVSVRGQARRLAVAGLAPYELAPSWRTRVLAAVTHPSVALILMTIGIYGLVFEFMNPGYVAPGVIGAICLLLALYALQLLPINYAGLGLVLLGLMLMVAEAFLPSFGVLGLGGIVSFAAGALMLVDTEVPGFGIPPGLVAGLGAGSAILLVGMVRMALAARRRPVASGAATLVGATARIEQLAPGADHAAWIRIEGELWQVQSPQALAPSQTVRVVGRRGLTLDVVPIDTPE